MKVTITPDGVIYKIHSDDDDPRNDTMPSCPPLRASHVEPKMQGQRIAWWADLEPVNGPLIGPFAKRSEALKAEVQWLEDNQEQWVKVLMETPHKT